MARRARVTPLKRLLGKAFFDSFFYGLDRIGRLHPLADPERHGIERIVDVPYVEDGNRAHLLDVYRPRERSRPLPVMIYVHGGGFRILSKDSHWLMGIQFARKGFVVFNINYRLSEEAPYPAAVEDTFRACTWIKENASRFGGDPERIHLAGESAGGNLVTSVVVATAYKHPEPWSRSLWEADLNPVTVSPACALLQVSDPERLWKNRTLAGAVRNRLLEVHDKYLPQFNEWEVATYSLADPLRILEEGSPPERPLPAFFACVGTADPLIDDTRRLEEALARLSVPCEARYYPGGIHAFHVLLWTKKAKTCWRDQFRFLNPYMDSTYQQ